MSKQFLMILAVIIVGFGGLFWLSNGKDAKNGGGTKSSSAQPTNHVTGAGKKGITLLEYGDYQCPACAAYHPIVKALAEKYKDDIYFQFRNYPLSSIHPNAYAASRAAEAAALQNKFWEMHDLLYQNQSAWSSTTSPKAIFEQYATQLSLDPAKFNADYASIAVNDLILADMDEGKKVGLESTPTFLLDGKKIDPNPRDQAAFDKLLSDAIANKK